MMVLQTIALPLGYVTVINCEETDCNVNININNNKKYKIRKAGISAFPFDNLHFLYSAD